MAGVNNYLLPFGEHEKHLQTAFGRPVFVTGYPGAASAPGVGTYGPSGHTGYDIRAKREQISAPFDADLIASSSGFTGGFGATLGLRNPATGNVMTFSHLSDIPMLPKKIPAGTVIGTTGGYKGGPNAGRTSGPHLHTELRPQLPSYFQKYTTGFPTLSASPSAKMMNTRGIGGPNTASSSGIFIVPQVSQPATASARMMNSIGRNYSAGVGYSPAPWSSAYQQQVSPIAYRPQVAPIVQQPYVPQQSLQFSNAFADRGARTGGNNYYSNQPTGTAGYLKSLGTQILASAPAYLSRGYA